MRNARLRFWIVALPGLAMWAAALLLGGPRVEWDEALRSSLYAAASAGIAEFAGLLTWLGDGIFLSAITALAALYLYFRRRLRTALLLITVFGGRLLVELQKVIISRDRPGIDEHLEAVNSMSFPSAHAANAMITFVTIALLLPVGQRNRAISVTVGLVLALMAGWTRVALGVHWPSDVIGGWAFGLLWIAICMRLASPREAETSVAAR